MFLVQLYKTYVTRDSYHDFEHISVVSSVNGCVDSRTFNVLSYWNKQDVLRYNQMPVNSSSDPGVVSHVQA